MLLEYFIATTVSLSKSIANYFKFLFMIEFRYRIRYLLAQVFGKKQGSGGRGQNPHASVKQF